MTTAHKVNSIHLLLPLTDYRPEEMRVTSSGRYFLVEFYSPRLKTWIAQKEHLSLSDAINDAVNWYNPLNSYGGIEKILALYKEQGATIQILNLAQPEMPELDDLSLAELFTLSDGIGDKYLTEEEIAERDRELAEAFALIDEAIAQD